MTDTPHIQFMKEAINMARIGRQSPVGGAFGAVVVRKGETVVAVHNSVSGSQDCTQHAELKAIQRACAVLGTKDLSDCILYTSCEPCLMCLGACRWANFKHIFFGASAEDARANGYIYSDLFYASNRIKRYEEFRMTQVMRDEAVALWKEE